MAAVYVQTGWLERLGKGAFKIAGDKVEWTGGLYAIQRQLGMAVHVGGKTALEMQGYAHFLPLGKGYLVYVFGAPGQKLPSWFRRHSWNVKIRHVTTNLFAPEKGLGLTEKDLGTCTVTLDVYAQALTPAKRTAHLKVAEMIRPVTGTLVVPSCSHAEEVNACK